MRLTKNKNLVFSFCWLLIIWDDKQAVVLHSGPSPIFYFFVRAHYHILENVFQSPYIIWLEDSYVGNKFECEYRHNLAHIYKTKKTQKLRVPN